MTILLGCVLLVAACTPAAVSPARGPLLPPGAELAAPFMAEVQETPLGKRESRSRQAVRPAREPMELVFPSGRRIPVEPVGATSGGAMAVPEDPDHAGWWKAGTVPGQPGSAVVDGHSGWSGKPAAFAELEDLREGDIVTVRSDGNATYAFTVMERHWYPADATVEGVFGGREGAWLNLITCTGSWNASLGTHDRRLVVYCRLVE